MDIFKQASKEKLRILTNRGSLTVEQLWDLSLKDLDDLAVGLQADYEESGRKSFLLKKSQKDKTAKLKFDIVLDVLNTKVEDNDAALAAKETKEHNQKILRIIAEKKDGMLKEKSVKELEKLLK